MREEFGDIATADGLKETFVCRPERGGPWPAVLAAIRFASAFQTISHRRGRAIGTSPASASRESQTRGAAMCDDYR